MKVAPIKYTLIDKDVSELKYCIGKPVMRDDRGYKEYGIITGFVNNLVLVHFGNSIYSLRLRPQDLYFVTVTER